MRRAANHSNTHTHTHTHKHIVTSTSRNSSWRHCERRRTQHSAVYHSKRQRKGNRRQENRGQRHCLSEGMNTHFRPVSHASRRTAPHHCPHDLPTHSLHIKTQKKTKFDDRKRVKTAQMLLQRQHVRNASPQARGRGVSAPCGTRKAPQQH